MRDAARISIRKIELPVSGIEQLQAEARAEGYNFIDRLVEEWASAKNRFDASRLQAVRRWAASAAFT